VFVHVVWGTWDRQPLIGDDVAPRLWAAVAASLAQAGCNEIVVGGVADHVHAVFGLPAEASLASVVQRAKGSSSHLANRELGFDGAFRWQGGYGAFGLSSRGLPAVASYVRSQREHHATGTTEHALEL